MEELLLHGTDAERAARLAHVRLLLEHASLLQIDHVTLPFVDASSIGSDGTDEAVTLLSQILPWAEQHNVELHLETDLAPAAFRSLLDAAAHPLLFANYDTGNSAALGFDPREEFAAYGDRIGSVHIKDRVRGGSTVPLGEGNADFEAVFSCLQDTGYAGTFILQVARGEPGNEVEWAKKNRLFVETLLSRYGFASH